MSDVFIMGHITATVVRLKMIERRDDQIRQIAFRNHLLSLKKPASSSMADHSISAQICG
jgi:hypothetical protein